MPSPTQDFALPNPLQKYTVHNIDESSNPRYYGFVAQDRRWVIMRWNTSTGVIDYSFSTTDLDYDTNWTGRAALSYGKVYA